MSIEIVLSMMIVFLLGFFTAYMDLFGWFKRQNISTVTIFMNFSALSFLVCNGLIGLLLLLWAIFGESAVINAALPSSDVIPIAVFIGISVPALIRSKWFTSFSINGVKEETSPIGIEAIYESLRIEVLRRILSSSIIKKNKIAGDYARQLQGNHGIPDDIMHCVIDGARPFRSKGELEDLEAEFQNYQRRFATRQSSEEHLKEIIRWAMDNASVHDIKQLLQAAV